MQCSVKIDRVFMFDWWTCKRARMCIIGRGKYLYISCQTSQKKKSKYQTFEW